MQTPENNNYEFHEDAGHGWLRVPYADLIELQVQPTDYSYIDARREFAYLEEDEDLSRFFRALDPQLIHQYNERRKEGKPTDDLPNIWKKWNIKTVYDGDSSFIRDLASIGEIPTKPTEPTTPTPSPTKNEAKPKANKAASGSTFFPELFDKWGIQNESEAERKGKPPYNERFTQAVRVLKVLKKWKSDSWYLMPLLWIEDKATAAREETDAERQAKAKAKQEAEAAATIKSETDNRKAA